MGESWGWTPDTVGTIATAGALLVAAMAYAGQLRDKRREQARHVTAWIDASTPQSQGTTVRIRNGGSEPVYRLKLEHTTITADVLGYEILPPNSEHMFSVSRDLATPYSP